MSAKPADDLTAYGDAYVDSYADEVETCVAALDRLHPRWRDRVPFNDKPVEQVAAIKRYLLRWTQITTGHGDWGLEIVWRRDLTPGRGRPYACTIRPAIDAFGAPVHDAPAFRQLINPAIVARRLGLPFDLVERALDARPIADRQPRAWVLAYAERLRCSSTSSTSTTAPAGGGVGH